MTSPVPADLLPFLPTLERARNDLCLSLDPDRMAPKVPPGSPSVARRLAAMVVNARVVRREVNDEVAELSILQLSAISGEMPPIPRDFTDRSWVVRLRAEGGEGQPCSNCDVNHRGYNTCHVCGGSYWRPDGGRCGACDRGYTPCAVCAGGGRTYAAEIRRIDEVVMKLNDVFVPELFRFTKELFHVPGLLRDALSEADPPMAMAFPIAARVRESAYRDAVRRAPEPIFQGYRLEDAMEKAKTALLAMVKPRTEIVLHEVRSFAWPLLWLTFGEKADRSEVVLVVRPDGQLAGYVAEAE